MGEKRIYIKKEISLATPFVSSSKEQEEKKERSEVKKNYVNDRKREGRGRNEKLPD